MATATGYLYTVDVTQISPDQKWHYTCVIISLACIIINNALWCHTGYQPSWSYLESPNMKVIPLFVSTAVCAELADTCTTLPISGGMYSVMSDSVAQSSWPPFPNWPNRPAPQVNTLLPKTLFKKTLSYLKLHNTCFQRKIHSDKSQMLIGYNEVKDHQEHVVVSSKNHSLKLYNMAVVIYCTQWEFTTANKTWPWFVNHTKLSSSFYAYFLHTSDQIVDSDIAL